MSCFIFTLAYVQFLSYDVSLMHFSDDFMPRDYNEREIIEPYKEYNICLNALHNIFQWNFYRAQGNI